MLYKHEQGKTDVIMCHDGNFRRIHELMASLKVLELEDDAHDCGKELYWSHKAAIGLIRKEIWSLFLEIEAQRAEYPNDEWRRIHDDHKKRREEHPGSAYPRDIIEID